MKRSEDKAISKHTLNLYAGDYQEIQNIYGTRIGAAKIIRDLVRVHIRKIKEGAEQKTELIDDIEIDLSTIIPTETLVND